MSKKKELTIKEALNIVSPKHFCKRYGINIKYLYHKKNGYDTAGKGYEFTEKEKNDLIKGFQKLSDELKNIKP